MIELLKISNSFIFIILALWHFYWALGGKIGTQYAIPQISAEKPEPLFYPRAHMTAIIGILLICMAISQWLPVKLNFWSNLALMLAFLLRAIGDRHYVGIFKTVKGTPFSQTDSKYFIPLCLLLSVSHAILLF